MYGNDKKSITTQGSLTNTSLNSTFLSANDAISHKISGPLLVATTVSSTIVSPQKNNRRGEESAHVKWRDNFGGNQSQFNCYSTSSANCFWELVDHRDNNFGYGTFLSFFSLWDEQMAKKGISCTCHLLVYHWNLQFKPDLLKPLPFL